MKQVTSAGQQDVDLLAKLARSGNHEAFNELVTIFHDPLTRAIAVRHNGNTADAEDIVQDALTKAFRCIGLYDERYSFRTWLFTIAFRISTDHLRRKQKRSTELLVPEMLADDRTKLTFDDEPFNIWQTARTVLSDPQYTALWLAYSEEMSPSEIGKVLGKGPVATRVLLYRARRTLHRWLIEHESHASSSAFERGESV